MSKYAIQMMPGHLDLIEYLNGGVRPLITGENQYYLFEMNEDNTDTFNCDIVDEDDLIIDGYLKDERILLK